MSSTNQCVICLETNQTTQIECITKDCNGMYIHNNCLEDFSRHFKKKCPFCQKDSLVYDDVFREIRIEVNVNVITFPSSIHRLCRYICNYFLFLVIGWGISTLLFSLYCLINTDCSERFLVLFSSPGIVFTKCFIGMILLLGCVTCCTPRR